jgi:diguanylate cyclase
MSPRTIVRSLIDLETVRQPRYRAWERRNVRTAARAGTAVVVVVLLIDAVLMSSVASTIALLNVPLAAVGALMHVALRWRPGPRRNPSGAALVLGILALTTSLLPLGFVPEAGGVLLAYVPIVIVASALFIPWNTIRHLTWLGICLAMVGGFIALPFSAGLHARAIDDLVTITIDAVLISLAGHLVLQRQRRGMFLQRMQLRGLNRLATRQAAELRTLAEELRAVARVDQLTGVANRLRLDEDLEMVARRQEDAAPGAALMIDIDWFKQYNDRHGHLAGDQVLRRVATALASVVRPTDRVYRYGGEEFLVLLPGASVDDATAIAERQREAVLRMGIPIERERGPAGEVITISIGVARMVLPASGRPVNPDAWLKAADEAMYVSKVNGRNQVTVAPDLHPSAFGAA